MDIEKLKKTFGRQGIDVSFFATAEDAARYLEGEIQNTTVGFGGSVTADGMNLAKRLAAKNTVYAHSVGSTAEDMRNAGTAEVFISGANAIAETGEVVNIDGRGNRVAATIYGCKRIYIVSGVNKLCPDLESAIHRARNVAAPKNAQRLGKKTPCAVKADRCYDCDSPERICRALAITMVKMSAQEHFEIVLIDEALGY